MSRLNKYLFFKKNQSKPLYLQDIFKPIYIVMTLLGLFPYSITFNKTKHTFSIIRSSIYVNSLCAVTSCFIIFLFFAFHIKDVLLVNENGNLAEVILTQMNYIVELVGLISFCIVAYISAFYNRMNYVKLLNKITSTWYDLPLSTGSKQILKNFQFHVNFVCMGSLLVIIVLQLTVNLTRDNSWWKMTLVTLTFDFPQMVQCVVLAYFYILVRMVLLLMITINWHCLNLSKYNVNASDAFVHARTLSLRHMERIYIRAFEIKTNINEIFQGPILVTALQSFHAMVSESHIMYHGIVVQKSITTHEIINCSLWIVYQIFKIYSIAYCGNLLKLEALKIGQLLHTIPTERHDDRWLMQIQHFSTMIYYQNIELSIYGYFPLNSTLIYNTLASATMYLIILVQIDERD